MRRVPTFALIAVLALSSLTALAQETPKSMVQTYDSLADAILAVKRTEANFVRTLLQAHRTRARQAAARGDSEGAAAEMALFANEGDNAIGGVRKRLLEGGHHHNAAGEAEGVFEPGYVIITRQAKRRALALSAKMRQASSDEDRRQAMGEFRTLANTVLAEE